jgi:hypothetical protein
VAFALCQKANFVNTSHHISAFKPTFSVVQMLFRFNTRKKYINIVDVDLDAKHWNGPPDGALCGGADSPHLELGRSTMA